jgi:Flp pilus assembly protein TadG
MRFILRRLLADRSGSTLPLSALLLVPLLGAAALGVDILYGFTTKEQLQKVADNSALAGVKGLPDRTEGRRLALMFAQHNAPSHTTGTPVGTSDVQFGTWNSDTRTFTAMADGAGTPDAIKITASLNSVKGNPLRTWFASAMGSPRSTWRSRRSL